MKKIIVLSILALIWIQCSNEAKSTKKAKPTKKELREAIQVMDDSLKMMYGMIRENKITEIKSLNFVEAANRNLAFYHNYPKDPYSAECLDKAQQMYVQMKSYRSSLVYSDTLLDKFPDYKNKEIILLNAGSIADAILNDTTLARKYYTRLLKDCPTLDEETAKMIQFRLKYLHVPFDEMDKVHLREQAKK